MSLLLLLWLANHIIIIPPGVAGLHRLAVVVAACRAEEGDVGTEGTRRGSAVVAGTVMMVHMAEGAVCLMWL